MRGGGRAPGGNHDGHGPDGNLDGPPLLRTRPARAHKTAMTVAQKIVHEISRRQHPPGTRLATERDMLAQYDVGRGTLRESLRFLEMNGVITMRPGPGGGPIVGEPDARDLAGTLGLFLELQATPFRSIVEVRLVLEPAIAAMAAGAVAPDMLARLRKSVEDMEDHLDDEERFLAENEAFHELVAWASGNPVFGLLIASLHWITDGTPLGVDYPPRRRDAVARRHRAIYEALASRDAGASAEAMREHVAEFQRYVERYYPSVYDGPLRWTDVTS
jgi:GntR family transcriptional repressor for pyruvate dehydrogenase complex